MVTDVIDNSTDSPTIKMSDEICNATTELRRFLFERVYIDSAAKSEESKAKELLARLYEYFFLHPDRMPAFYAKNTEIEGVGRAVCDYISSMTDRYAIDKYKELFIPEVWQRVSDL